MSGPYRWLGLLTLDDLLTGLGGLDVSLAGLGDDGVGVVSNV